jgi:thymidylate synthase (FAD)
MKVIEQSYQLLYPTDWVSEARMIEAAGRTAYKTEDKATEESYKKFLSMLVKNDHGAVLEFGHAMIKFTTSRSVTHELVRHRMSSYVMESQRYCNYNGDKFSNEITFVLPGDFDSFTQDQKTIWYEACEASEKQYFAMIKTGALPQRARAVLNNSVKADIVMKANWRELLHVFKLRCAKDAHPDIRELFSSLADYCAIQMPCVFATYGLTPIGE